MLIVFFTAYFAVNRSNNNFSKMLGMYLIFHWLLYFLEVPRSFDIYNFFFYLINADSFKETPSNSTSPNMPFNNNFCPILILLY